LTRQSNPIKPVNDYARYSTMAFQMIAIIGIGTWFGYKMDHWLNITKPIVVTIFALISVIGAIVYFIRESSNK